MIHGGITPNFQPLDVMVNKVVKGHFRDLFEEWSLHSPINPNPSYPYPPLRQLFACWLLAAWIRVSEELVGKSWIIVGYRTSGELGREVNSSALVYYSEADSGSIVEDLTGDAGGMAWMYHDNGKEDPFPDMDNNVD